MAITVRRDLLTVEHVALSSGIYVERAAEVTADDHPEVGFTLRMEVAFDNDLRRLVARRVSVESPEGYEVTGTLLRAVRVQEILQQAGLQLLTTRAEGDHGAEMRAGDFLKAFSTDRETHEKSPAAAAKIYEVAVVLNYPPLKTISELLGVSQSTATRLVGKARELGILRPEDG